MRIDIVSIFPDMFAPLFCSILKRAQESGVLSIHVHNLRDFTNDRHKIVDDYPFGGGSGMVMKPEPIYAALEHVRGLSQGKKPRVLLMCPQGRRFTQSKALHLAEEEHLIFLCGHYEGIDDRIRQHLVDEEISIGDYVLTGGELPAMVIIDAVARMLPGVLGAADAASSDSFYAGVLEYPQYTRPREFMGWEVPDILLSGDHGKIERWRRKESLRNTMLRRPDLLNNTELTKLDLALLAEIKEETEQGD
jgi:tRNA (guanine37-N1)-methyltransferase